MLGGLETGTVLAVSRHVQSSLGVNRWAGEQRAGERTF